MGLNIAFLRCDVTVIYDCGRILLYGGHHFEWQKYIAVIERKVLIVSLFGNTSVTTPTRLVYFVRYKHIDLYMQVLLE